MFGVFFGKVRKVFIRFIIRYIYGSICKIEDSVDD